VQSFLPVSQIFHYANLLGDPGMNIGGRNGSLAYGDHLSVQAGSMSANSSVGSIAAFGKAFNSLLV
jgi:hypothetical protein